MPEKETIEQFRDRILDKVLKTQVEVFNDFKTRHGFEPQSFEHANELLRSFAKLYLDAHSILVGAILNFNPDDGVNIREPTWMKFSEQIANGRREGALERQKTDPQAVSIAATQCARLAFADFFEGEKDPETIAKAQLSLLINLAQDVVAKTGNAASIRIGVEMGIALGMARLDEEKAGSTVQ